MQKLYYGGDILTMVRKTDAPEALLVEDGRIRFVGGLTEAKALCGAKAEFVNLGGRALLPSFIDGHSHISLYAKFASFPDASGCTSFAELALFLKNCLKEQAECDVLLAVGYDHNFLKEGVHPTRELLDEVSETVPICLYHSSGHMCVVNTAMLRQAGITERAADPRGGHYGRYADGTLNGYLEEPAAFAPVLLWVLNRLGQDPVRQLHEVQEIYLKYGITTVQDGGTSAETLKELSAAADAGCFRVDVVAYPLFREGTEQLLVEYGRYFRRYQNRLKVAGTKIFLDGSPQGKSAWLTRPYEGEESYCGYPTEEDSFVTEAAKSAIMHGCQLLAHCNGDAASDQYIRCYKRALKEAGGGTDLRPVMIHCQTVRDDQLKEMADIGMLPSIFVAHTYYWGDVHLKNLGAERGARISPVKSALDCGLRYNFHQDCPVLAPDMMKTVWCAVNRVTRKGIKIGEEQAVDVFEALKGITVNAAYAYHEEHEKGTLEPGKLADMVILEENPLKADRAKLADIRVCETIKEGQTLYRKEA